MGWYDRTGDAIHRPMGLLFKPLSRAAWLLSLSILGTRSVSGQSVVNNKPDLALQTGHTNSVYAVAFSPDGRWLASASYDSTVVLWEVATGWQVRTLAGHSDAVNGVAFSPDGRWLASASSDKTVKLWEVTSGANVRTLEGHLGPVNGIAFSPDGRWLASASSDKTVKLWEVASGGSVRTLEGYSGDVNRIAFSPNGRWLASGGSEIKVSDVATGDNVRTLEEGAASVNGIAFSPDGRWLTSSSEYTVKLWEVASGKAMREMWDYATRVSSVTFSPDGRWLAGGCNKITVLWDVNNGRAERTLSGHASRVISVAFSSDGHWLASGQSDGTVELSEVASGSQRTLSPKLDSVRAVSVSPDGRSVAVGNWDKTVKLWDVVNGREVRILSGYTSGVNAVTFSPDGRWLASASAGNDTVQLRGVTSAGESRTLSGHTLSVDGVNAVAFSPDGQWLASGSGDNTVKLWEVVTGKELRTFRGHISSVETVAFSPDGRFLASGSWDTKVKLWEIATGRDVRTMSGHKSGVFAVAFSPDGRLLASGSSDKTVKLWDVDSGREVRSLGGHIRYVRALAFSPEGRLLASGGGDNMVKLWDVASGREMHTLSGHTGWVRSVVFSPDGRWLVSGSQDGTTRIWDSENGIERVALMSFSNGEDWLTVSPDGLFDGTADAMQQVGWRSGGSSPNVTPLDSFFTDFYYPGLLGEIISGVRPKPQVDIATALQVPGLRAMMAAKLAHLEKHEGSLVVCFEQKPGAAVNVGPTDQRIFFPPVHGYEPGTTATCKFEKPLPTTDTNSVTIAEQLRNWKPEVVTTPWDGKVSNTADSTLHVLTVGVSQYPSVSGFEALRYAVPSAKEIETFFRGEQISPKRPYAAVRLWDGLYDAAATREKVRQRLTEMAKEVGENDVVLLYLAGHGKVALGEEMFYFVPVDGRDDNLRETGLSTAILAEGLRNLPARRIVLIVDACQSGGAIEALSKIGAVKAQVEQRRGAEEPKVPGHEHGVGVHLIAATLPLSFAVGLQEGRSALAETLIQALRQGGHVTAVGVSAYIKDQLPVMSDHLTHGFRQVPLTDSIGLDFPISEN